MWHNIPTILHNIVAAATAAAATLYNHTTMWHNIPTILHNIIPAATAAATTAATPASAATAAPTVAAATAAAVGTAASEMVGDVVSCGGSTAVPTAVAAASAATGSLGRQQRDGRRRGDAVVSCGGSDGGGGGGGGGDWDGSSWMVGGVVSCGGSDVGVAPAPTAAAAADVHSGIGRPQRHAYVFSSYRELPTPSSPSTLPCSKCLPLPEQAAGPEAKHLEIELPA
jgi:hypothetical protein